MQICIIQIFSIGIHINFLTICRNGLIPSERTGKQLNQQKTEYVHTTIISICIKYINIYINMYFSRFLRDYMLDTVCKNTLKR